MLFNVTTLTIGMNTNNDSYLWNFFFQMGKVCENYVMNCYSLYAFDERIIYPFFISHKVILGRLWLVISMKKPTNNMRYIRKEVGQSKKDYRLFSSLVFRGGGIWKKGWFKIKFSPYVSVGSVWTTSLRWFPRFS